ALNYLQTERASGRNPMYDAVLEQFQSSWNQRKPEVETAHAVLLARHAESLLASAHQTDSVPSAQQPSMELIAALPNGSVRIRCAQAEELPDGTLRLTRQIRRRAKKEDANEERLALMRYAAKQQQPDRPVEIALHYLREGETQVVEEKPRYEPNRVA